MEKKWRLKILVDLEKYPRETVDKGLFDGKELAMKAVNNSIIHAKKHGIIIEREKTNITTWYLLSQINAIHYTLTEEEVEDAPAS